MSFVKILMSVPDSTSTMEEYLQVKASPINQVSDEYLQKLLDDMVNGAQLSYTKISVGALQASGTDTLSGVVATDTVTVNGVVFTAVASGATGNQFNVGGSDSITATNLASAVNASVTANVIGVVTAAAVGPVVTFTAVQPGLSGNLMTLAASAHGTIVAPAGGTDGTQAAINYGAAS